MSNNSNDKKFLKVESSSNLDLLSSDESTRDDSLKKIKLKSVSFGFEVLLKKYYYIKEPLFLIYKNKNDFSPEFTIKLNNETKIYTIEDDNQKRFSILNPNKPKYTFETNEKEGIIQVINQIILNTKNKTESNFIEGILDAAIAT
jgi:hypothetical protein